MLCMAARHAPQHATTHAASSRRFPETQRARRTADEYMHSSECWSGLSSDCALSPGREMEMQLPGGRARSCGPRRASTTRQSCVCDSTVRLPGSAGEGTTETDGTRGFPQPARSAQGCRNAALYFDKKVRRWC